MIRQKAALVAMLFLAVAAFAQAPPVDAANPAAMELTPIAQGPLQPVAIEAMSLDEMPPEAPRVSWRGGQLSVRSVNATLASILRAIQVQTGAEIVVPEDLGDRVSVDVSGPVSDVIFQLMEGSHYGYVIRSTPQDPDGMSELILTKKPGLGATKAPVVAGGLGTYPRPLEARREREAMREEVREAEPATPAPASSEGAAGTAAPAETNEPPASSDKAQDAGVASVAAMTEDPHPAVPIQTATAPDQAQQQQESYRQFMQNMYTARQKMQPQAAPANGTAQVQ